MRTFKWEDIDHSLVSLKLTELVEEIRKRMKKEEERIYFENRGNMNDCAVPSLILEMKQNFAHESARRVYEIYYDVWQTQGNAKSAAFIRAICAQAIVPALRARANAIAGEFTMFVRRTNFPPDIGNSMLKKLDLDMQRLQARWERRLEAEAKECEHAERRKFALLRLENRLRRTLEIEAKEYEHAEKRAGQLQQVARNTDVARVEAQPTKVPESSLQTSPVESGRPVPTLLSPLNNKRLGRHSKRPDAFVVCAGSLWKKAISENKNKVSDEHLEQIAHELDTAGHVPPSAYLEGKCAQELKPANSRNSNSRTGPVMTWSGWCLAETKIIRVECAACSPVALKD